MSQNQLDMYATIFLAASQKIEQLIRAITVPDIPHQIFLAATDRLYHLCCMICIQPC